VLSCSAITANAGQSYRSFTTPAPIGPGQTLVIGFLGGFERWDDEHRSVRKLALKLREIPNLRTETVENHRRGLAAALILRALDRDHNGMLDAEERRSARIILYGQSLGGSAAMRTARDLAEKGIPVLLTVQVDSVGVGGVIPPNVAAAANLYQHELLTIRGQTQIHAADPGRTRILGNFKYEYPRIPIFPSESLPRTVFGGAHSQMEMDPRVWMQVESLILGAAEK
jgi:pimeloyl-ACP methyl ester carboxylesterase